MPTNLGYLATPDFRPSLLSAHTKAMVNFVLLFRKGEGGRKKQKYKTKEEAFVGLGTVWQRSIIFCAFAGETQVQLQCTNAHLMLLDRRFYYG